MNPIYVHAALARLRETKPKVFGSEAHGFRLNPPASEAEVVALERSYGFTFPAEYRAFVTEIGNGGAGPAYGLFRLGETDDDFDFCKWSEQPGCVGDLSKAFRFDQPWNDLTGQPDDDLSRDDPDSWEVQQEEFDERYWGTEPVDGSIGICHEGCALRILLIVTGPLSGQVWRDSRADMSGLAPVLLRNGERATFSTWYEEWLVDALSAARSM